MNRVWRPTCARLVSSTASSIKRKEEAGGSCGDMCAMVLHNDYDEAAGHPLRRISLHTATRHYTTHYTTTTTTTEEDSIRNNRTNESRTQDMHMSSSRKTNPFTNFTAATAAGSGGGNAVYKESAGASNASASAVRASSSSAGVAAFRSFLRHENSSFCASASETQQQQQQQVGGSNSCDHYCPSSSPPHHSPPASPLSSCFSTSARTSGVATRRSSTFLHEWPLVPSRRLLRTSDMERQRKAEAAVEDEEEQVVDDGVCVDGSCTRSTPFREQRCRPGIFSSPLEQRSREHEEEIHVERNTTESGLHRRATVQTFSTSPLPSSSPSLSSSSPEAASTTLFSNAWRRTSMTSAARAPPASSPSPSTSPNRETFASSSSSGGSAERREGEEREEEYRIVERLHRQVQHVMSARQQERYATEFFYAYRIVKEAERDLAKIGYHHHHLHRDYYRHASERGADSAGSEAPELKTAFALEPNERAEACVYERVGQLQRTFQGLSPLHYQAVSEEYILPSRRLRASQKRNDHRHRSSHHKDKQRDGDGDEGAAPLVLLRFVSRVVNILLCLRRLPQSTSNYIPVHQAKTYMRTSGCGAAVREAVRALINADTLAVVASAGSKTTTTTTTTTCQARNHEDNHASSSGTRICESEEIRKKARCNRNSNYKSSSSSGYLLGAAEAFSLFDAALTLPSEVSPLILVRAPPADVVLRAVSSSSAGDAAAGVTAITGAVPRLWFSGMEEYAYLFQGKSDSKDGGKGSSIVYATARMKAEEWCVRRVMYLSSAHRHDQQQQQPTPSESEEGLESACRRRSDSCMEAKSQLSFSKSMEVLRGCMYAQQDSPSLRVESSGGRGGGGGGRRGGSGGGLGGLAASRVLLRVPYGLGREFTRACVTHLYEMVMRDQRQRGNAREEEEEEEGRRKAMNQKCGTSSSASSFTASSDSDDDFAAVDVRDIATLCAAVLFFEVFTCDTLQLLKRAAPRCVQDADLLSGHDISCVLLTYAKLKFSGSVATTTLPTASTDDNHKHISTTASENNDVDECSKNIYVVLGTRAGQLGEYMNQEDTTRVLHALDLVGIEHDNLRRSLESSLRMRNMGRRVLFDIL